MVMKKEAVNNMPASKSTKENSSSKNMRSENNLTWGKPGNYQLVVWPPLGFSYFALHCKSCFVVDRPLRKLPRFTELGDSIAFSFRDLSSRQTLTDHKSPPKTLII
jgi:hypothetical protein